MFRKTDFRKLELFGNGKKNTKIFKVEHLKTGKIYVLKEVEARSLEKLNEYKEEAVQLSRVQNHPNILQIYGYYFSETPHNTFKLGIISEYINREFNLEIVYHNREKQKLFWKEDQLLKMIYSLIDAFAYLENVGICHRDIKPTNLFSMENYEIKVIDFGESKEFVDDNDEEHSTMATIRGTPQYLSPILWEAHVITGAKQVEHNMFKSDVFSAGLVLFQIASMRDVTGFNQKTDQCDGEKLIREGFKYLSKIYSNKVIDIIRLMLTFDESRRPNFIDLGKVIVGPTYTPRTDMTLIGQLIAVGEKDNKVKSSNTNAISTMTTSNINNTNLALTSKSKDGPIEKTDEEKMYWFKQYKDKHRLNLNMNKITFWFEFGGSMIAKFYIKKEESKWKLIGKYKSAFPYHFVMVYIDEDYGHFLIGGTDSNNTFQYKDGQITKKNSLNIERSFMSVVYIDKMILAIGGYEYNEKGQLSSIEAYNIDKDSWNMSLFKDLQVARSQANSLVYNNKTVYVFGGYNKSYGTLNSIEKISIDTRTCELIDMKLPVPLRRFASLKITESRVLIMGGITRLCKETDNTFILDFDKGTSVKFAPLPKGGIIDQEVIVDEMGQVHLFFENNYGTSPPIHMAYNYLDFN